MPIEIIKREQDSSIIHFSGLAADVKGLGTLQLEDGKAVGYGIGSTCIITDGSGGEEKYCGSVLGWVKTSINGLRYVRDLNVTTAYRGAKQANGSAGAIKYETVPPNVTRVLLTNVETTAGENLLHSFGIDDTDAGANIVAGADVVLANKDRPYDIPKTSQNGGSFAYISQTLNLVDFHLSWLK